MESKPRLKAEIWVKAYLRRLSVKEVPAFIVRRGDSTAGQVAVRINRLDGTGHLYLRAFDGEGRRIWHCVTGDSPAPDTDIDSRLQRERKFDPDLWVVEVEDRAGRAFLDEGE
jgi:hypothetical protein